MTHGWLMFRYRVGVAEPLEASTSAADDQKKNTSENRFAWSDLSVRLRRSEAGAFQSFFFAVVGRRRQGHTRSKAAGHVYFYMNLNMYDVSCGAKRQQGKKNCRYKQKKYKKSNILTLKTGKRTCAMFVLESVFIAPLRLQVKTNSKSRFVCKFVCFKVPWVTSLQVEKTGLHQYNVLRTRS